MNTTDGLDSLDALASRAKRKNPPPPRNRRTMAPQHPAPAPTSTAAVVGAREATGAPEVPEGQQQLPGMSEERPAPDPAPAHASTSAPQVSELTKVTTAGELRKVAVYLDEDTDTALEAIRYAGTTRRPRLDVSKSAVVRLALERLLTELSHEEVVATIAARPTDSQATGRKRR